ncbi:DUF5060 domain-containing protein [Aureliella helgolandensis]|uniref:DUF5060 domain-containing protein n=1 Tax=Aureliella helgolandensis TaxID=2527968 RepID=A0A518GA98_9BACT|nr:DUF5060 domain-containing protein [Aureliella helgolandensis]QDV25511.1 hypothetical protein Q31a_38370 [Aureliella helgolandensis]
MNRSLFRCFATASLVIVALVATSSVQSAWAKDATASLLASDVVFAEADGLVAVEAEHFARQELKEVRAFQISTAEHAPSIEPDGDPLHIAGAAGGAYVELLPDSRRNHSEKLIKGVNFSNEPGKVAVLTYRVHFANPGRYYVWVRAYSSGSEDNGIHVGIDGTWPESGQRMQWCEGKQSWRWESKQRTEKTHCGEPYKIYLDVPTAGIHEISFSMREDGFEFDRWLMTQTREFSRPDGIGPDVRVHSGTLPASYPFVPESETQAEAKPVPDVNSDRPVPTLRLLASQLDLSGTGYYLDKGKWLAINPAKNKQAKVLTAFAFPSGRYDVTLVAVGEEDGKSTYQFTVNDEAAGEFTCPLSEHPFEEGPKFSTTWKNIAIGSGDVLTLSSQIGSNDGAEFSRARIAKLEFVAADQATRQAVAKLEITDAQNRSPAVAGPPLVLPRNSDGKGTAQLTGELKQWHKVTLTLDGPYAHELDNAPNPFTDLAFQVTFTHESGSPQYTVPGYFAADGDAGNSSADAGTKWRAHLSPDKVGRWNYAISFKKGETVALNGGGQAMAPFDGVQGSFEVAKTDKEGRDFRARGRLEYVGKHHLQFAGSKEYFLKAGPDAPETLLAYVDFDNTIAGKSDKVPLKQWQPHVADWQAGDPTWKEGKGKGLIGALNYLASKGVNAFSFLTYNAGGDGDNIWPFVSRDDKLHWDCSKLDQWGVVLDHATAQGLYLHFKLQENEMDDDRRGSNGNAGRVPESLDGGKLGVERKLYCRELIARYGHELALNWNIGEENTQSSEEIRDMVKYLHDTDPYQHNIVIHTFPSQQDKVYTPLLGDKSLLTGASLQNSWSQAHQRTLKWLTESAKAGRPWVVANDEQNPASDGVPADPGYKGNDGTATQNGKKYTMHDVRKLCLWGTLMAGGAGVEYYFGYKLPENDLVCQDFRSRDRSWDFCRIALEFFANNSIPFWEMHNADELIGNPDHGNEKFCLAQAGKLYLVYLPNGGTTELNLSEVSGDFSVEWFNPRSGGELVAGEIQRVAGGGPVKLGTPPSDTEEDWLIVVRQ